jgi:hypothetical protein
MLKHNTKKFNNNTVKKNLENSRKQSIIGFQESVGIIFLMVILAIILRVNLNIYLTNNHARRAED